MDRLPPQRRTRRSLLRLRTADAFGDRYVTELCPANPDVRIYARALAVEVARVGVETIVAESLHYHPLEHGYAHERYFVPLGPRARYLLGLCFCRHCLVAASCRWTHWTGSAQR